KGIIHRDLKPSNVLVTTADERAIPKVIDFGIARAIEGPLSGATLLTEAGQIIGTPEYMSPEQAGDDPADVDTRSDVYALGVLLYELLTSTLPLERSAAGPSGLAELLYRVRETEPPRPSRRVIDSADRAEAAVDAAAARCTTPSGLARALRGDLDWIALRALAKNRAHRYGSAAEFADDIRRHLRDEPVAAGPPSAAYRVIKFARRHAGLLSAAAAILVALVAGLIGTWTGLVRARHEAERARTEAAIAEAVNRFLNEDLLASVAPGAQGRDVSMREVLDTAAERLEGRFNEQPVVAATLRRTIGATYTRLGRLDDAAPQLERSAAAFENALGADDPRTLEAIHALAELRFYQGRPEEAEALLLRVVEERRRVLGPDDAATLAALSDLGAVAHDQGRLGDAERHYRAALGVARRTLPPDDRRRLAMAHNLGALLRDRAQYEAAEAILREAWEASRDALGAEHPETLATLSLLGSVLREADRLDAAEPIYTEVFESRRRVLGDEHPSTLLSANNLAMLATDLGNYAQAERWQRFALEGQLATLGADHDATILSWGNLGAILTADGRAAEAEPLLAETVERARRVLGAGHPLTGHTLRKYGNALLAMKRWDDAEPVLLEAHEVLSASLEADHPDTRRTATSLASLYEDLGRAADEAVWRERAAAGKAP
ncbi:MAG: serine/threonine protein kinase, partial [Acidobacteriota bacterium]